MDSGECKLVQRSSIIAICAVASILAGHRANLSAATPETRERAVPLPIVFEANLGQFGPDVRFVSRTRAYTALFGDRGASIIFDRSDDFDAPVTVHLSLVGATPRRPTGLERQEGVVNYLIGNDPRLWRTDVPTFSRIAYENVRPGIDVTYYGRDGSLEYDVIVAPTADPSDVVVAIDGAESIAIDTSGHLQLVTKAGTLTMRAPEVYQWRGNARHPVAARYTRLDAERVGFSVGAYDRSAPLRIDPQLVYGTFQGGSGDRLDQLFGVAVDEEGSAYVVGMTETTDFPVEGSLHGLRGDSDAVITKLTSDGRRVYSTYLGGSGADGGIDIAVRADGTAYVLGNTTSRDFPVVDAYQRDYAGANDVFLVELSRDGRAIARGTYLGGSDSEQAGGLQLTRAVDVGSLGDLAPPNAFGDWLLVYGSTRSPNFPTIRAAQGNRRGERDGFFAAFDRATLRPGVATYVGREGDSRADGMAISQTTGDVYLYLQRTDDVGPWLARLSPAVRNATLDGDISTAELSDLAAGVGNSIVLEATAFAGSAAERILQLKSAPARGLCSPEAAEKRIKAIRREYAQVAGRYGAICEGLSGSGNRARAAEDDALKGAVLTIVVTGCLPIAPASTCAERAALVYFGTDMQVLRIRNFGGARVGRQFAPSTVLLDTDAKLHMIGSTSDRTLPLVSPIMSEPTEAFALTMDALTGDTSFFTYLGGAGADTVSDVAVDVRGNLWIVGTTQSRDFPVTRSGMQQELNGRIDGFILKIAP